MFDSLAPTNILPTNTVGVEGNTINAIAYKVLINNLYKAGYTAGFDLYGQGGIQSDPDLYDQYQIAKWIASYVFLSNKFDCTFASNVYTLTPKTLNTTATNKTAYQLPVILQDEMVFEFIAPNSSATTSSLAITGLTSALPILKMNNSGTAITYSTLVANDVVAGQKVQVIYNSTANSGNPAFVLLGDTSLINRFLQVANFNTANNLVQTNSINQLPALDGSLLFNTKYIPQRIILSNNLTNPNTQIDFSAGNFIFSDYSGFTSLSAITKRLDANWVAGTNQGGLDIGAKAVSTWYYCYAIYNPTTSISDVIFSINNTTPTLPSDYTKYKLIHCFKTNSSGEIIQGTWFEDGSFEFASPILDATTTGGTITLSAPNIATEVNLFIVPEFVSGGQGCYYRIKTTYHADNGSGYNAGSSFVDGLMWHMGGGSTKLITRQAIQIIIVSSGVKLNIRNHGFRLLNI